MSARLSTPTVHRVISSPLGALLDTAVVERLRLDRLPMDLRLSRLGAAAMAIGTVDVDALLAAVGVSGEIPQKERQRLTRGLVRFARAKMAREKVLERWDKAFWSDDWCLLDHHELVELEMERRARSRPCLWPAGTLGFFAARDRVPMIGYRVPPPGDFAARFAQKLAKPESARIPPRELPPIQRSLRVPGPAGWESLIRFRSPSPLGDDVYARVFEPELADRGEAPTSTFIYVGNLFGAGDSAVYWPEEECIGRALAARGVRVVLVEPPFHGRRAPPFHASGEAVVATAPEGFFLFAIAGALEVATLVAWARELGSSVVGVGGSSIGALVAQEIAGRAQRFPRGMRPDAVFLAGAAHHLDEALLTAPIAGKIGLAKAILEAGWTREALACLRDLLDPPGEPGVSPDRIFAVLGAGDELLPFGRGRELLRKWRVPDQNVTLLRGGQWSLLLHLVRHSEALLGITRGLHRAARCA